MERPETFFGHILNSVTPHGTGPKVASLVCLFIIPLCSNKLRILNLYRGCSIRVIPALSDLVPSFPSLPDSLSSAGARERPEIGRANGFNQQFLFAYFRVVLCYFCVNSIEKSYRKAIINY